MPYRILPVVALQDSRISPKRDQGVRPQRASAPGLLFLCSCCSSAIFHLSDQPGMVFRIVPYFRLFVLKYPLQLPGRKITVDTAFTKAIRQVSSFIGTQNQETFLVHSGGYHRALWPSRNVCLAIPASVVVLFGTHCPKVSRRATSAAYFAAERRNQEYGELNAGPKVTDENSSSPCIDVDH